MDARACIQCSFRVQHADALFVHRGKDKGAGKMSCTGDTMRCRIWFDEIPVR